MTNSKSLTKEGGFMYVKKINGPLVVRTSTFSIFTSPIAGSFLYSKDSDFGLDSDNSNYECST